MGTKILVTGFRPFGSIPRNPSGEIAAALDGTEIAGVTVRSIVLPVVRARAFPEALETIDRLQPRAVVALGLAADREVIHVEDTARNLDHFEADEAGERAESTPVAADGPAELPGTLEPARILEAILAAGVPARPSRDAGSFLCNHLYYGLLREAAGRSAERSFRSVFLHLPGLAECRHAADGSLRPWRPLEETRRGVVAAVEQAAALVRT